MAGSVRRQQKFADLIGSGHGTGRKEKSANGRPAESSRGEQKDPRRPAQASVAANPIRSKTAPRSNAKEDKGKVRNELLSHADLKEASFSPEKLLEKLMLLNPEQAAAAQSKSTSVASQPSNDFTASTGKSYSGFPGAKEMLDILQNAQSDLDRINKSVANRVRNLEKELSAEEDSKDGELEALEEHSESLFASFHRLDGSVTRVGHTAARIGDRLERADAQRQQAKYVRVWHR